MDEQRTHAYVGVKPCGCAVAAAVDYADKATAESVSEMILNGYSVERVTLAECRERLMSCGHNKQLSLDGAGQ